MVLSEEYSTQLTCTSPFHSQCQWGKIYQLPFSRGLWTTLKQSQVTSLGGCAFFSRRLRLRAWHLTTKTTVLPQQYHSLNAEIREPINHQVNSHLPLNLSPSTTLDHTCFCIKKYTPPQQLGYFMLLQWVGSESPTHLAVIWPQKIHVLFFFLPLKKKLDETWQKYQFTSIHQLKNLAHVQVQCWLTKLLANTRSKRKAKKVTLSCFVPLSKHGNAS